MSDFPKVTVVIPAYNVGSYIRDALVSLEQQSLPDFEAIIVNDGSTDNTAEIAQEFCDRDSRFKLLTKMNGGLSSARNAGIRQAKASYIALLDGDDRYEPEKLANHVQHLDRDLQIGVVYSASNVIREDGRPTWMPLSGKPLSSNLLFSLLCKNFVGHGSNAVFRRQIFDQVGEFDETLRSSEDIDFWLRIATTHQWTFYREPKPLSCYRVRPAGLSFNLAQMQYSHERVLQAAYERSPDQVAPWLPTAYAHMYRFLARIALTAGDVDQARYLMQQSWRSDRSIFLNDPRSLLTLVAVQFAPLSKRAIARSLKPAKTAQGRNS